MSQQSVFQPVVPEGFEWILPVDDADFEVVRSLDGTSRRAGWRPIPVRVLRADEDGSTRRSADIPWLGDHVLVLSCRGVGVLGEVLSRSGELLPLECDDGEYWLFNALRVVDALDFEASELVRFTGGRVLRIVHHEFIPQKLVDAEVFKLPEMLRGSLYATDEFVTEFRSSGLLGTEFCPVWRAGGQRP